MRRLLATLAVAALVACGDSTSPQDTFGGDYVLQTINGKPLPYTWIFSATDYYRLNAYRFTILPGSSAPITEGSWLSAIDYAYTDRGQVISRPSGGEIGKFGYTSSTGNVWLLSEDQTTFLTGTVSGNTMTITKTGEVWVFKR